MVTGGRARLARDQRHLAFVVAGVAQVETCRCETSGFALDLLLAEAPKRGEEMEMKMEMEQGE